MTRQNARSLDMVISNLFKTSAAHRRPITTAPGTATQGGRCTVKQNNKLFEDAGRACRQKNLRHSHQKFLCIVTFRAASNLSNSAAVCPGRVPSVTRVALGQARQNPFTGCQLDRSLSPQTVFVAILSTLAWSSPVLEKSPPPRTGCPLPFRMLAEISSL